MPPGPLYSFEYVTAPIAGSSVRIGVSLVNTSNTDSLAGIFVYPNNPYNNQFSVDQYPVPANSMVGIDIGDIRSPAPAIQGWLSIQVQSERVVPSITIINDGSVQIYLPGDFVAFDLQTGKRL